MGHDADLTLRSRDVFVAGALLASALGTNGTGQNMTKIMLFFRKTEFLQDLVEIPQPKKS